MEDIIYIGNDHGGYRLKLEIMKYLDEKGIAYKDCGCDSEDIVRYPYYADMVASAVSEGKIRRGILICSTGVGMSIIANRYKNVRASLCATPTVGHLTRAHNDSNILCLGGKITGVTEALAILEQWLFSEYEGGRHDISLGLIAEAENALSTGGKWEHDLSKN